MNLSSKPQLEEAPVSCLCVFLMVYVLRMHVCVCLNVYMRHLCASLSTINQEPVEEGN